MTSGSRSTGSPVAWSGWRPTRTACSRSAHWHPERARSPTSISRRLRAGDDPTDQTFVVNLYDTRPDLPGATELCESTDTFTDIDAVISANANKVNTVVAGPSPAALGGIMTVTVEGETGTVGAAGIFAATPAAFPDWPANAYQLVQTDITFTDLSTSATDDLFLTGLADTAYTAVYTFVAVGVTPSPTPVSPIANISSGTQIKHTSTGSFGSLPPIQPANNTLSLSKSAAPTLFSSGSGGTATFTVTLSNSGGVAASLDDLVDTLPTGTTYAGDQRFNGAAIPAPAISGQTVTFVGPFSVPAGGSSTITYDVTIPAVDGTYVNSAIGHIGVEQIDTTEDTTDDAPASASASVGTPPADVSATATAAPTSATAGQNLVYTIQVDNAGPGDATDVVVTETLPAGVTFVSTSGCAEDPSGVPTCSLGTVVSGGSTSYTVTVAVDAGTTGTLSNTVAVATSADDSNSANNTFTLATPVAPDITLGLTKTFSPTSVTAGSGGHTFDLTVANTGASDATGVRITDTVDARLTVTGVDCIGATTDASSGQNVDCTYDISGGGTATVSVTYEVAETVDTATVANNATADDGTGNSAVGGASVSVVEDVSLSATKTFVDDPVTPGDTARTFTIAVGNGGVSDADAVRIVDTVDAALTVTGTNCAALGGTDATSGNRVDCLLPILAAGSTRTLSVSYDVPLATAPQTMTNTASVSSDEQAATDTNTAGVVINSAPVADTDGDGIPDSVETTTTDTDGDGTPDYQDLDSDNDGIPDSVETAVDTDGDGTPDHRDLDSDNDGIPDVVEAGGSDTDGDGTVDGFTDGNGDGWDDTTAATNLADLDSDDDGKPDRLEVDADDDSIPDEVEGGYPPGTVLPR